MQKSKEELSLRT